MKKIRSILCLIGLISLCFAQNNSTKSIIIPTAGNSFEIDYSHERNAVEKNGIKLTPSSKKVSTYFKLGASGNLNIKLLAKINEGEKARLQVGFGSKTKTIDITATAYTTINLGSFNVPKAGYAHLDFISSNGEIMIKDIVLEGSATTEGVIYCSDPANFYWTRRGPSCHLGYSPKVENATYFYNEVRVPKGQDVIGTYFMANGFAEGYFGIQVNSEKERRILFSVWSPFHTDDPNSIPDDQKILLLKKGNGVYTGEFGNEGSGGQSFLRYNWQAETTYKFLLKGEPDGKGNTVYSAWFFAPENNNWQLIASFQRPKTNTFLKGFHSFLENFSPNQGYLTRQVEFRNQWVYNGTWTKMEEAKLTVDATYRQGNRVDATGGTTSNGYYLKMGGFFDEIVPPNSVFQYNNNAQAPVIDFNALP